MTKYFKLRKVKDILTLTADLLFYFLLLNSYCLRVIKIESYIYTTFH